MNNNIRDFVLYKITKEKSIRKVREHEDYVLVNGKIFVDKVLLDSHVNAVKEVMRTDLVESDNKVCIIINDIIISFFGFTYYVDMISRLSNDGVTPVLIFNNADINPLFVEKMNSYTYESHLVHTGAIHTNGYLIDSQVEMLEYCKKIKYNKILITDVFLLAAMNIVPGLNYFNIFRGVQEMDEEKTNILDGLREIGAKDLNLLILESDTTYDILKDELNGLANVIPSTDNRAIKKQPMEILVFDSKGNIPTKTYESLYKVLAPLGIGLRIIHGNNFNFDEMNSLNENIQCKVNYVDLDEMGSLNTKLMINNVAGLFLFDENIELMKELDDIVDYSSFKIFSGTSDLKEFQNETVFTIDLNNTILAIKSVIKNMVISENNKPPSIISRKVLKDTLSIDNAK